MTPLPQQPPPPKIESDQVLNILGEGRLGLRGRLFGRLLDARIDPEGEDDLGYPAGHISKISPASGILHWLIRLDPLP